MQTTFHYDVIVIGAGHAGCEAAQTAARMGAKTCVITMDMNKIAQMSCNPAIGGIAKGQIVREVDALGGGTGEVTDACAIQFRMLNRSKGPAMWSPRAQCDRPRFIQQWRRRLETQENLAIWQDEATEIIVENGRIGGVDTLWGARFYGGHISEWPDARGAKASSRRTMRRTSSGVSYRIHHKIWDSRGSHENGNARTYRCALSAF